MIRQLISLAVSELVFLFMGSFSDKTLNRLREMDSAFGIVFFSRPSTYGRDRSNILYRHIAILIKHQLSAWIGGRHSHKRVANRYSAVPAMAPTLKRH